MSKIFVRERTRIRKGSGRPRFAIVATEGLDMKFYASHIRKLELEKLAEELQAEVIYLPRGEKTERDDNQRVHKGHRHQKRLTD